MLGKQKCRILKEIRRRIADENDIPYVTHECRFQGECRGSCPRCESELRYLERQLALRASMGKRVAVTALCAAVSLGAAGCAPFGGNGNGGDIQDLSGMIAYEDPSETSEPEIEMTTGEIAYPEESNDLKKDADPAVSPVRGSPDIAEVELMGDIAWFPEDNANG